MSKLEIKKSINSDGNLYTTISITIWATIYLIDPVVLSTNQPKDVWIVLSCVGRTLSQEVVTTSTPASSILKRVVKTFQTSNIRLFFLPIYIYRSYAKTLSQCAEVCNILEMKEFTKIFFLEFPRLFFEWLDDYFMLRRATIAIRTREEREEENFHCFLDNENNFFQ